MPGTLVIFDDTGRIREVVSTYHPKLIETHQRLGSQFALVEPQSIDLARDYWDGTRITRRPEMAVTQTKTMIAADGLDVVVLGSLPQPCIVYVDGTPNEVDDGELELQVINPGVYKIVVRAWPHAEYRTEITAV